jgi:predicted AlkP superfamily pyrophosphatase or phosphodiesterase
MNSPSRRSFISAFCFLLPAFWLSLGYAAPAPPKDRIVILISLDAFRWDYLDKFKPPHLTRLANEGVHAERLIPMFPSMTFPNHQTIATGLRPAHHGIIHNDMYDPNMKERFGIASPATTNGAWWGGEPIWVTAVKQGRIANAWLWPGVGAPMSGMRATEWKTYDSHVDANQCVDTALSWLERPQDKRPSLLVLYFHQVDTESHRYGTESPEVAGAVRELDDAMGRLVEGIHRLKLDELANLVIVSDHGMANISTNRLVVLEEFVSADKAQVDFTGAIGGVRPNDGDVDALYAKFAGKENHFHVYRRENMPEKYHYTDNPRIPPVVIVPEVGWYVTKRSRSDQSSRPMNKATHGWDPNDPLMGATFIAWGPAFRQHTTIKPFENVHIYNLLSATVGLKPAPNDGDNRLLSEVLADVAR